MVVSHPRADLYLPVDVPRLEDPPSALEFLRSFVMPNLPVIITSTLTFHSHPPLKQILNFLVDADGFDHWPALTKWTNEYLAKKLCNTGNLPSASHQDILPDRMNHTKEVTVDVTPTGYGDAPVGDYFVTPHERRVTFPEFLQMLQDPTFNGRNRYSPHSLLDSRHREFQHKHHNISGVPYVQHQNNSMATEFSDLWEDIEHDVPWATEALGVTPDVTNFWMGDQRSITSLHKGQSRK